MDIMIDTSRVVAQRDPMLYGHFIEHFHRQIYGGVFAPGHPLADEDGFRQDVLAAMRHIHVPVLRWPGGCFVSSYHWKNGVGKTRTPFFDKAWRIEDPNHFGTDEFCKLCRKIGCEPYICTNAGTGTAEEMSDWVEYCNLHTEGQFARSRIANGFAQPHGVTYWSIGNENYGTWELGAKECQEWGRLVQEAAKMIKHVDPTTQLSAAALADVDWNLTLLKHSANNLDWISLHEYWDKINQTNAFASYEQVMAYTAQIEAPIRKTRGLLMALGLESQIKIAFDEWNLRAWFHPNMHTAKMAIDPADYLAPRAGNDENRLYTMADAVFSACFLNCCNRNGDLVRMANFAPIVNTRGCIYTHEQGLVLRTTYHVFDLYVNVLGDTIVDSVVKNGVKMAVTDRFGAHTQVEAVDLVATLRGTSVVVAAVNKQLHSQAVHLHLAQRRNGRLRIHTLTGDTCDAYNDIGHNGASVRVSPWQVFSTGDALQLPAHSVNMIELE